MADFSMKATDLQGPQGAGSSPQSAVQMPANVTPNLSPLSGLLSGITDLVGKGGKPWDGQVGEYVANLSKIAEARERGELSDSAAANQTRMLTAKMGAQAVNKGWGLDYMKDVNSARENTVTGVGLQQAAEVTDKQQDLNQSAWMAGAKDGFIPKGWEYASSTPEQRQIVQDLYDQNQKAKIAQDAFLKLREYQRSENAEGRAKSSEDRQNAEYTAKLKVQEAVGDLTSKSFDMVKVLVDDVKKMDVPYEEKAKVMTERFAMVKAKLFAITQYDPQAASALEKTISGLEAAAQTNLDPRTGNVASQADFEGLLTKAKIDAIHIPGIAPLAGLTAIVPNNPYTGIQLTQVMVAQNRKDLAAVEKKQALPSVAAGDTKAQEMVFKATTDTINRAMTGKTTKVDEALDQTGQVASSAVKSFATFRDGDGKSMEKLKNFVASPEFGHLVKSGKVDLSAAGEAATAFNGLYMPALTERVRNVMSEAAGDTRYENGKPSKDNAVLMNLIDFQVDDSGTVTIVKSLSPEYRKKLTISDQYIDRMVRQAKDQLEGTLNSALRVNAHLAGRTDYKKYYEENAPAVLRGFIPPDSVMEQLKAKGYKGTGNVANPNNWTNNATGKTLTSAADIPE